MKGSFFGCFFSNCFGTFCVFCKNLIYFCAFTSGWQEQSTGIAEMTILFHPILCLLPAECSLRVLFFKILLVIGAVHHMDQFFWRDCSDIGVTYFGIFGIGFFFYANFLLLFFCLENIPSCIWKIKKLVLFFRRQRTNSSVFLQNFRIWTPFTAKLPFFWWERRWLRTRR